jgi:tRNA-uridine 2-sulfurtransferase
MRKNGSIKTVALFSGGLDSVLATRVILEQGIAVTALHIRTSLSYTDRARMLGEVSADEPLPAESAAAALGVELVVIDAFEEYLPMVLEPRYGYGSGVNPCIDCRIFLLRRAKQWMEDHSCHFVFTGEVVGQRPKSQKRPTLRTVERESGLQGYLLRPLSAKLLDPTIPEEKGWVDRSNLFGFSGRGRKDQIALAKQFGIVDYAQPSGGCCYLIDKTYARRLRDVMAHDETELINLTQAQLLAVGRHFRLPDGTKVIVGRDERENEFIDRHSVSGVWLRAAEYVGPTGLVVGAPSSESLSLAAQIVAGYGRGSTESEVVVELRTDVRQVGPSQLLRVAPLCRKDIHALMV